MVPAAPTDSQHGGNGESTECHREKRCCVSREAPGSPKLANELRRLLHSERSVALRVSSLVLRVENQPVKPARTRTCTHRHQHGIGFPICSGPGSRGSPSGFAYPGTYVP